MLRSDKTDDGQIVVGGRNLALFVNHGNDNLTGDARSKTLDDDAGNNVMMGWGQDNIYVFDSTENQVFKTATALSGIEAGGIDRIHSSVDSHLDSAPGVGLAENLILTEAANSIGGGNSLAVPPPTDTLIFAVNAGGGAVIDTQGIAYEADTAANWIGRANTYADPTATQPANGDYTGDGIGNADDTIYSTERWGGGSGVDAPLMFQRGGLTPGGYVLKLKFADIFNSHAERGPSGDGIGARVFDVVVNGVRVVNDLDLIATAGVNRALDFDVPVTVGADGLLTISAVASADNAKFSAIALFAAPEAAIVIAVTDAPTVVENGDAEPSVLLFGLTASTGFTGLVTVNFDTNAASGQSTAVNFINGAATLAINVPSDAANTGDDTVTLTLTGAMGGGLGRFAISETQGAATGIVTEDNAGVQPPPTDTLIFAVNAGGGAVIDTQGIAYEADTAANWIGRANTYADPAATQPANGDYTGDGIGNADDTVYSTERWGGGSGVDAPLMFQRGGVAPGDYVLKLKFADIFNSHAERGPSGDGIGARVFDVVVNGVRVVNDLDLIATAGVNRALDFDVPVTVGADGLLTISAVASADNAKFSAIALFAVPEADGTTPLPPIVEPPPVVAPPPVVEIPADAIRIAVGANAQQLVNEAPEGATFWFEAGVHRLVSINPKDGQTFLGDEAAVISGAKLLTGFAQDGNAWVIGGQTQEGVRRAVNEGQPGFERPGYPDAVFMDNVPLTAVASRSAVSEGKYYFDYAADRIYLGDNPNGRLVEAAVSPFAFAGSATDVTIRGLTVEKYASAIQFGAIGHSSPPVGWLIEDNEVRLNFGVGITGGTDTQIIGNYIHNNGQMGLGGHGNNILVQGNEIEANGFWSGISVMWEAGGAKFSSSDGLIVRDNYSHHNNGLGLWTDINNTNTLYEDNRLEWNSNGGISHEISFGGVIRNNSFLANGAEYGGWLWGAAIQIQNSSDVEIYGNTIDMNNGGNGISLIQQNRGGEFSYADSYFTTGNFVHGNVLIGGDTNYGNSGAIADAFKDVMLQGGNRFDNNTYYVASTQDAQWVWGDFYDWDTYRQISGQDANSQVFLL